MHYFRVFRRFLISNFARETEFRFNFLFWIIVDVFWVTVQIYLVSFFYQFTDSIAGWTQYEVYLLIGLYRIIEGVFHMFVYPNLLNLPESITRGDFDYILSRPIHSLFTSSFRYTSFDEIGTAISGLGILVYSYSHLGLPVTFLSIVHILFLLILSLMMFYSFVLFFSTLTFYFTRMTALGSVYDVTAKALRVPGQAITGGNKLADALLLPFMTIVTIPSQLILGRATPTTLFLEIASVLVFFVLAYLFWNFSIRHYSSASS